MQKASQYLGPCTLAMDDEMVVRVKKIVEDEIEKHWELPLNLLDEYNLFAPLVGGLTESQVTDLLMACQGGSETIQDLDNLAGLCEDLQAMVDAIRDVTPDLCFYPMFMVNCYEAKQVLKKKAEGLRAQIVEHVSSANHVHMTDMCREYQDLANRLVEEPADSAELKTLQEFAVRAMEDLKRLESEYLLQVYERVRFLLEAEHRSSKEDLQLFNTTYNWPNSMKNYLGRSRELQQQRKRHLQMVVEGQQEQLLRGMDALEKKVERIASHYDIMPPEVQAVYKRITNAKTEYETFIAEAESIKEQEELLQMPLTDNMSKLKEIKVALDPLDRLWSAVKDWVESNQTWQGDPLPTVDAEDAERKAAELMATVIKVGKVMEKKGESRAAPKRVANKIAGEVKAFIEDSIPLMQLICTQGLKERHWEEIINITGLDFEVNPATNLEQMLALNLQHHVAAIEDTCVAASKENALEKNMDKMEAAWANMEFGTKEWRGSRILSGIDEIQTELDDQIVKTQAMRGNRYIKPFEGRISAWEKTLVDLQDIMDNWLKVQATWLYLEPIFSSDDIMRQMPIEAKLFVTVDSTWRASMTETFDQPAVMAVAHREGLLEGLIDANKKLDTIQKGLNDYLETKMLAFPRFFFLSNDELLEILAETKDPTRVQPHLKKCFDGIAKIEFNENLDILSVGRRALRTPPTIRRPRSAAPDARHPTPGTQHLASPRTHLTPRIHSRTTCFPSALTPARTLSRSRSTTRSASTS